MLALPLETLPAAVALQDWQVLPRVMELDLVAPLSLRSAESPCCTLMADGMHGVFTGIGKDARLSLNIYNPSTGETVRCNAQTLDRVLAQSSKGRGLSAGVAREREAEEAVFVLFDCSGSMHLSMDPQRNGMSRLAFAKQLFFSFSNRTIAYDLAHAVGLIKFGSTVEEVCALTMNLDVFADHVDALVAGGDTALYQALNVAGTLLQEFKHLHPRCALRCLVLSDGDNTVGGEASFDTSNFLRGLGVQVDAVIIGDELKGRVLRAISGYTGGLCFAPPSVDVAVKLFESDAMLSLRERAAVRPYSPISSDCLPTEELSALHAMRVGELRAQVAAMGKSWDYSERGEAVRAIVALRCQAKFLQYVELPMDHSAPPKLPLDELSKTSTTLLNGLASQAAPNAYPAPEGVAAAQDLPRRKRILRNLHELLKSCHPSFTVLPAEDQIDFCKVLLVGPHQTAYDGTFLCFLSFPAQYPQVAPVFRFVTPIYHCNINANGRVCHSVLDRNWTRDTSLATVFGCIYGLLLSPEPDDPLDSAKAAEWHQSREVSPPATNPILQLRFFIVSTCFSPHSSRFAKFAHRIF